MDVFLVKPSFTIKNTRNSCVAEPQEIKALIGVNREAHSWLNTLKALPKKKKKVFGVSPSANQRCYISDQEALAVERLSLAMLRKDSHFLRWSLTTLASTDNSSLQLQVYISFAPLNLRPLNATWNGRRSFKVPKRNKDGIIIIWE